MPSPAPPPPPAAPPRRPALRYCAMAPGDTEGWLALEHARGGLLRGRRPRYLRLRGGRLACARAPATACLWALSVRGAPVGVGGREFEVVVGSVPGSGRKGVSLFARDGKERDVWLFALRKASLMSTRVEDYYRIGGMLGEGMNGQVREACDVVTGEKVAVKMVPRLGREHEDDFLAREVQIVLSLEHENIVRVLDVFVRKRRVYFVMEFLPGGELFDYVSDCRVFDEDKAMMVVADLLAGLTYLHDRGVVHRDVKLENLLTTRARWPYRVKLADFGFSNFVPDAAAPNRDAALTSFVGTPYYIAPEMLSSEGHGRPVDLWATGVTLYILLSGKFPFGGDSEKEYYARVLRKPAYFPSPEWDDVSDLCKDLLCGLLTKDPTARLTARQALGHAWFDGLAAARARAAADSDAAAPAAAPAAAAAAAAPVAAAAPLAGPAAGVAASSRKKAAARAPLPSPTVKRSSAATSSEFFTHELDVGPLPPIANANANASAKASANANASASANASANANANANAPPSPDPPGRAACDAVHGPVPAPALLAPVPVSASAPKLTSRRRRADRESVPGAVDPVHLQSASFPNRSTAEHAAEPPRAAVPDAASLDRLAGQLSTSSTPAASGVVRSSSKARLRAIAWTKPRSAKPRKATFHNNSNVASFSPSAAFHAAPHPSHASLGIRRDADDSGRVGDNGRAKATVSAPDFSAPMVPGGGGAVAGDMARGVHADRPERLGLNAAGSFARSSPGGFVTNPVPAMMSTVQSPSGEDAFSGFASRASSATSTPDASHAPPGLPGAVRVKRRHSAIRQMLTSERLSLDSRMPPGPRDLDSHAPPGGGGDAGGRGPGGAREWNNGDELAYGSAGAIPQPAGGYAGDAGGGKLSRFRFRSFHRTAGGGGGGGAGTGGGGIFVADYERVPPKVARARNQAGGGGARGDGGDNLFQAKRTRSSWSVFQKLRRSSKQVPNPRLQKRPPQSPGLPSGWTPTTFGAVHTASRDVRPAFPAAASPAPEALLTSLRSPLQQTYYAADDGSDTPYP